MALPKTKNQAQNMYNLTGLFQFLSELFYALNENKQSEFFKGLG